MHLDLFLFLHAVFFVHNLLQSCSCTSCFPEYSERSYSINCLRPQRFSPLFRQFACLPAPIRQPCSPSFKLTHPLLHIFPELRLLSFSPVLLHFPTNTSTGFLSAQVFPPAIYRAESSKKNPPPNKWTSPASPS